MFFTFAFFPEQASTVAKSVDSLYSFLIAITVFFSVLIFSLVFIFAFKYRRKSKNERPAPIHGSNLLESIWTIIPLLITIVIFVWGTTLFFHNMRPPANALEIFVVGKQWMWKIQHPEGPREINELHIPIGKPVKLKMTSEDVIHSFYVPAFRTKMDVVPGRYTTTWFEATKPGRYHLFCAEYCGTKHAGMGGWVIAMKPEDYQAWLRNASGYESASASDGASALEVQGRRLFKEFRCDTCHHEAPTAIGAKLDGIYGRDVLLSNDQTVKADENYLRRSILEPNAQIVKGYNALMPTYKGQLGEEQVIAIIAYLKSLKAEDGEAHSPEVN